MRPRQPDPAPAPARPVAGGEGEGVPAWAPFAITAGAAGLGWVLRVTAGEAVAAAAAGLLVVPALLLTVAYLCGRRLFGVDRPATLAYTAGCWVALAAWAGTAGAGAWPHTALVAAAVVGAAAGWVAYSRWQRTAALAVAGGAAAAALAAVLFGATRQPNPARWALVWAAATSVAAAPWWQRERAEEAAPPAPVVDVSPLTAAIVKHLGHAAETVPGTVEVDAQGRYSVRYLLADGKSVRHLQPLLDAIESELGWRPGALHVEGSRARRNEVTVSVVPEAPVIERLDRPAPPTSITQPAPLGRHDTGAAMELSIYSDEGARGGLLGGQKGSGKSRVIWTAMDGWTATDDALFVFGDMSGGATSTPWLPCITWRETEPDRVLVQIEALTRAAVARAATLPDRGWESWQPSPDNPAIVFVIDEAQRLLKSSFPAQQALSNLMQIDRKSGISVVLACPNPVQMEGITPTVRQQCALRLCMKAQGSAAQWVLGNTPAFPLAGLVESFDKPGQILGSAPGLAALPGRTYDTNLADAKAAAIRNSSRRPQFDQLTADALRAAAGDAAPAALAAGPGRPAAAGGWTDRDDQALRRAATVSDDQIRDRIRGMAQHPNVLGQPWPDRAAVPAVPGGRLTTEQALRVLATMLAQPGGVSPAEAVRATGFSRAWVNARLAQWVDQGVAAKPQKGRYTAASVDTPGPTGG